MKKICKVILSLVLLVGMAACNTSANKEEAEKKESKEITIYLVRHGKTWFNTNNQVQGWSDSPLTDVGVEQAKKVGVGLKDVAFSHAFSSDLGRQRSTAQYILSENKNEIPSITELLEFREKNYGSFEGGSNDTMNLAVVETLGVEYPTESDALWDFIQETMTAEELASKIAEVDPSQTAETAQQVKERGAKAMELMMESVGDDGSNVLIVSSGGIIPLILEAIAPGEYNGEKIANCSVTVLKYKDGKYTVDVIGDTTYVE
ncbi:putative phosphoglycerate mutase [Breznakia blatticola]|uniref:Putative phosphoglycerate mutase n=1 Tax=Breznakia blatticola TaxID=1754012 RepID=A0A4R8A759_9FIRM|nr:histidine phosphatase family protein [Breznakia blatticola]TDW26319.1 putative phosphoglycerate mutase [Breznakia blatticola]